MKISVKSILIASMLGLVGFSLTATAQEKTIEGVVVSKNESKNTITVRGDVSGKRHTYFVEDETTMMSQGKPIKLSNIRRGQKVSLAFRQTDEGRELVLFRVPNPDEILELIPVEMEGELTITGNITGVRPIRRTISIRSEDRTERLTLHVPKDTKIIRNGKPVAIAKLLKGDQATFRYHITEEGFIIISGRTPMAVPASSVAQSAEAAVPMLPKTASNNFAWLFGSLGLLMMAGIVSLARRRAV